MYSNYICPKFPFFMPPHFLPATLFHSLGSLLFPCQVSLLLKDTVSVMTKGAIEPLCNESLQKPHKGKPESQTQPDDGGRDKQRGNI